MADTWTGRDLPVLKAIIDLYESSGRDLIRVREIVAATGFDQDTVQRAVRALYTEPYLQREPKGSWGAGILGVGPPTGDALRIAGVWPSPENLVERLIAAFENAAADDDRDAAERSKFKQAAGWLGSFASQVAIGALGGAGGNMLS
jgi:hypothetical protein